MCRELTEEDVTCSELETILEFLVKIRNICCHDEMLFSFVHEEIMIPNTEYHKYFNSNSIQYGKKDFLAALISIKLLSDKDSFSTLINSINQLINKNAKKLGIAKQELLYLMHLPKNFIVLKKI